MRVDPSKVVISDDRLADNSYEALNSRGESYGLKAHNVLKNVKGRAFRHEKTKKKRGTYRGGKIDLSVKSIKFED
jgi:hypothetical protein